MSVDLMQTSRFARQATFAWRHGSLLRAVVAGASVALIVVAGIAAFQLRNTLLKKQILAARLDRAQRDASMVTTSHEPPPDIVQRLPAAPSVDQLMNVLQRVAAEQGVRVESLQSDDHLATPTELGRLGIAVTLRAPYPAIVHVLQALLDRYPGATLRRLELARAQAAAATAPMGAMNAMGAAGMPPMPGASVPAVEVEAHVTLDMWSRAVGVVPVPSAQEESPPAAVASEASAAPAARTTAGASAAASAHAASTM
ncbi:MAG TPA: GspMb/PilO family protein, partial [Burkholderiaceae bacterium]